MRRYLEIYAIMFRNSLIREMSFKANFLLWIIVEALWFMGQIVFVEVLFQYVDQIGDWTKWQVILLIGTHQLILQIFQAFFYNNIVAIPELVRTGRMDFMMLLPMDTQFAVSARHFGLDSLVNAGVSVAVIGLALSKLGLRPSAAQWILYAAAVGFGIAIHYAIMFFLTTLSFWIVRAQGLVYGYYNLFNIARYPDSIFRGAKVFRFVFTWIIPVILVANVPARLLIAAASQSPAHLLLEIAAAALIALSLNRLTWKFALTRYTSASS
ncbi:MAG: ABC-2 family transporter protein [Chthoniobacteraceae bacterium]|nr:ABC-2 family transporter protein [Chthoniobacteraceae bacterium]